MKLWTAAEDEKLKQLYAEQYSCSQIAGFFEGKSRNAVIGRVHRLGLPKRGKGTLPARSAPRKARNSAARTRRIVRPRIVIPPREEINLRCAAIEPIGYTLDQIPRGACKWPFGDGPFLFCGHPIAHGSYCTEHFLLSIGPGTSSEQAATKISRRKLEGAW